MEAYVTYASALPPSGQLPTLIVISFLMGLGKGGVPGLATVANAATVLTAPDSISGGLGYAVALMVPILTITDVYASFIHRHVLDWTTIWLLLPTSFMGMIMGQFLDGYLTDAGARVLIGIILLGILVLQNGSNIHTFFIRIRLNSWRDGRSHKTLEEKGSDDEINHKNVLLLQLPSSRVNSPSKSTTRHIDVERGEISGNIHRRMIRQSMKVSSRRAAWWERIISHPYARRVIWACIVGVIGGMTTMLTNSMGPIVNVYLLSVAELSPQSYVGTRAMFFCFVNLVKLPLRVVGGTLGIAMVPLSAGLGAISAMGVFMAKPIMMAMNEETFVWLELAVVAFAGIRLCCLGVFTSG